MLKRFVYVLRNDEVPPRYYTRLTSDVATRHATHNAGHCRHTAKHRPWFIDVVISGNFWRLPQAELGSVVSNCVAWGDWP
jgi:predicted GIY-YIG superfamily endonuclease